MEAVAARCPATGSIELKSASGCPAQDAGSEGGGRPSILAMVWLRPPPWVQSEVVTPIGLSVILPMASLATLTKVKLSSTAEVLEVFHQPLEAIISLRRYIARLIY